MLHEFSAHVFHNEYTPRDPRPDDYALCYKDKMALLVTGENFALQLPTMADIAPEMDKIAHHARYLFSIDERAFYLMQDFDVDSVPGAALQPIEVFRSFVPQYMGFAGVTGSQLQRFYDNNRFCGHCATPMRASGRERALECPNCKLTCYPKISPAVIVGVTDGDRLLLTKYAGRIYTRHALVAGFAEFGESIEHTVAREVMEEVGLRVKHIRYFNSQPWPFSDSLLLGFFCDLDGDAKITLDEHELCEAEWFDRDQIPSTENTMSLTNTMIEAFRGGNHPR